MKYRYSYKFQKGELLKNVMVSIRSISEILKTCWYSSKQYQPQFVERYSSGTQLYNNVPGITNHMRLTPPSRPN